MDRFLEEQESGGGTGSNTSNVGNVQRDRSTSPNIHCLIYGDPKRQQRVSELTKDKLESLITLKTSGNLYIILNVEGYITYLSVLVKFTGF